MITSYDLLKHIVNKIELINASKTTDATVAVIHGENLNEDYYEAAKTTISRLVQMASFNFLNVYLHQKVTAELIRSKALQTPDICLVVTGESDFSPMSLELELNKPVIQIVTDIEDYVFAIDASEVAKIGMKLGEIRKELTTLKVLICATYRKAKTELLKLLSQLEMLYPLELQTIHKGLDVNTDWAFAC